MAAFCEEFTHLFAFCSVFHQIIKDDEMWETGIHKVFLLNVVWYALNEGDVGDGLRHLGVHRLPPAITPYDLVWARIYSSGSLFQELLGPRSLPTRSWSDDGHGEG